MNIMLLYGTETGNAEMLAEDIMSELEGDHEVECRNLSDFSPDEFDAGRLHMIICSSYGDGELPASAQPFAEALKTAAPNLKGIHFGIFGLGDREYEETFGFGSGTLAELLIAHGAVQIGERITHDASGSDMAEDVAFPWASQIVTLAEEKIGEVA
ncbi:flavodoxin domain-containing protein [Nitratireductor rhodophyticola]|uniref:flavodoxin domain-containing protein n=1 Tax=Nitratireductor rhodophyticola TaxID=2854036 RepID=UPI002AC9E45B|nr:flavodoxin domain-containing protein [Nitratireductor rhodophyticola]WPZ12765.1 flavodoxin domain-containing protein [Nitratireductor rhodophyticola]